VSLFTANHSAIQGINHLGEIINDYFLSSADPGNNSKLGIILKERLMLHRTKCWCIILNVIAPCLIDQLKEDIGSSYYSIIVDESTDIGTVKLMAYS